MLDKVIKTLLTLHGNEATELSQSSYFDFLMLISELLRIKYCIRYHNYDRPCQCQPEEKIKSLIKTNIRLNNFLSKNGLLEEITEIVNKPINKDKTVWSD